MKLPVSVLLAALLPLPLFSQTLEWARQIGGSLRDVSSALKIDAAGNLYTTGSYTGLVDFDPGPGVSNVTSVSFSADAYLQKLDKDGNLVWVKSMGGKNYELAYDMAIDQSGNFYLTGIYQDSADFDPGPGAYWLHAPSASYNAFITKLDSAGNFVWARGIGDYGSDEGRAIAVDESGNVYTAGLFEYEVDFDPSADTFLIKGSFQDVFILKLDPDGNFLWARRFGELPDDEVHGLAVAHNGDVLVFGHTTGVPKFGTSVATDSLITDSTDPFLLRIDPAGNLVWAKHFGGPSIDRAYFMDTDAEGNIYTGGSFWGTADLDPGPGAFLLTSSGTQDNFLQKLDPDGNFLWAMQYPLGARPAALRRDAAGNLILYGILQDSADLDPGPGVLQYYATGLYDFFVQKLDPDRELVWTQVSGGPDADGCSDIQIDSSGAIFLTGSFRKTLDAAPGPAQALLNAKGGDDIYILKWQPATDYYGLVFNDLDSNQVLDPGEPLLPDLILAVPNKGAYASTNDLGKYRFNADLSGDTLFVVMPRAYWSAKPAYYLPDSTPSPMNFAVHIQQGLQDVAVSAIALKPFRPGTKTEILIQVVNFGSARVDSVPVIFSITGASNWLTMLDAEPAPTAIFGDSVVWLIDSLEIESAALFWLRIGIAPQAVPGTTIKYAAETPLAADIDQKSNRFELEDLVVGSFDPNDKQVSPALFPPTLLDSLALRYIIRFQNTGNYPAERVRILDTLPETLDPASLRVIGASHPFSWRLTDGRVLEFLFDPIALPDSVSDELGSHGFAAFSIRARRDLAQGDSIFNRAAIYFDFNAPVLTAPAVAAVDRDQDGDGYFSQDDCDDLAPQVNPGAVDIPGNGIDEDCDGLDAVSGIRETPPAQTLQLWPNPARDRLLVSFDTPQSGVLEIRTPSGRLLYSLPVEQKASCVLDMGDYPKGMYLLRFQSREGRFFVGKIVLE